MTEQPEKAARLFKILSIATRVRMIELLKQHSLCVNALSRMLGVTPAAVSQHLRILRDSDVVIARKTGYFVHYQINPQTLKDWSKTAKSILEIKP